MMVELTDYERDNLLALLEAISNRPGAQRAMNNGDWVRQIASKLGWSGAATDWGRPNCTADLMAEGVEKFRGVLQRKL